MRKIQPINILFVILVSLCGLAHGQGRPLEFNDLLRARRISEPAVSPDGRWVAFVVTTYDTLSCERSSDIYLIPLAGGSPRPLTTGGKGNSRPIFTPDGNSLLFASQRGGTRQFYLLPLEGGEALQLTNQPGGTEGGALSPDGKYLLYSSEVLLDSASVVQGKDPGSAPRARLLDRLLFRHWDTWRNGKYSHLFVQRLQSDEPPLDLTPGAVDCPPLSLGSRADYAAGKDSRYVYYAANRDPMPAVGTNNDLWRVDIGGGHLTQLTNNPADDCMALVSPDGRYLAYLAMERAGFESDRTCLWLRDLESGEAVNLTGQLDLPANEAVWAPDGDRIFFIAEDGGKNSVFQVNAGFKDKREVKRLTSGKTFSSLAVAPNGRTLVALRTSFHEPAELVALAPDGSLQRNLTLLNDDLRAAVDMRPAESFHFPAEDSVEVYGFLIRPPAFDPQKKYPLVYLIHGGPQGSWIDEFHYRWNAEIWAAWGYVVVLVNPRGSTGYGQRFTDQISGDWGGKCYRDLLRGLDYVLEHYDFIDRERLGAAGASFGGYMVNWINGHTDRFKVLVCHDGVYNAESMYSSTEELWFPEWEFGGTPWDNPTLYRTWSPHLFAKNFKTPELIIHGEQDFRVPAEQGFMAFTTLQRLGIDSKLLYFPDEGHWVLDAKNSRLWHQTIREWLAKYLQP